MTFFKIFPKQIMLITLVYLPAIAQSPKMDTVTKMDTAIVTKAAWKTQAAMPYQKNMLVKITVPYAGGKVLKVADDAKQRLKNIQSWGKGPDCKWADVPYHLLIAPDGTVYEGVNPLTVGETYTEYNPIGHLLICFLGNYSQQKLDEKLLKVLTKLLADSNAQHGILPSEIYTDRDHIRQTSCPGGGVYSYFKGGYIINESFESKSLKILI